MRTVTRVVVACAGLVAATTQVPGAGPPPAAAAPADYTFHFTLLPPTSPLGRWSVEGLPATPVPRTGATILNGDAAGVVAKVKKWVPALNHLTLRLPFRNVGTTNAAAATLVVDMISPAWDATLAPSGGYVVGSQTTPSNASMFGERIAVGAIPTTGVTWVPLTLGVGSPGAPLQDRYDVYVHVETTAGGVVTRHGLPYEGQLAHTMAKVVAPPPGGRYLALDTISPSDPTHPRWADRFEAKYNLHPAIYQFIGAAQSLDVQSIASYVTSIKQAAARGMVPAVQLNVGTVGDQGNWSYQEIVDGVHDEFITELAVAIRDLGYPVIGFVGEEFNKSSDRVGTSCGPTGREACSTNATFTASDANAYGDPAYPDGPERFRDSVRHIVDLFDEVGATNVTKIIMTNNASYNIRTVEVGEFDIGFPYDHDGTADGWWDAAQYYYPGPDYLDITGTQVYNNFPNPTSAAFPYPSLYDAYTRHKNGYLEWTAIAPDAMFALPDEIQMYASFPEATQDRSPLIEAWYDNMARFPKARYFGLYESGADNGFCVSLVVVCPSNPPVWVTTGLADYGYFHPEEIETFRAGEQAAGFVQTPTFSAQTQAPARITDLAAAAGVGSVSLTWTAPGAEGATGTAHHYVLRCRLGTSLVASTWSRYDTATLAAPAPLGAGATQTAAVSGLAPGTYACGVKATNGAAMSAPISNVVTFSVS